MMKQNFPALTGIRAIAAYMVFIHHKNPFNELYFGKSIYDFFSEFHVGVTLFFVLSGFLICNRYYDDLNFNFKDYLLKRFARIYPLYFIVTSLTFIFYAVFFAQNNMNDFKRYVFNILFLRGFFDDIKFSGVAQGWSLTVEEMFYFLAPLFFILIRKTKWFFILIPITFIILGVFLVNVFSGLDIHGFFKNYEFMFDFTFFGRITEFFVGMALALFLKKDRKSNERFKYFTLIGVIGIIINIYLLSVLKIGTGAGTDSFQGKVINTLILPCFGIAPLFYGLIREKTIISKLLSSDLFVLLGKSSYAFYLIHIGIFMMTLEKITNNVLYLFVSLNLIAVLLYLYLEKPLNDFFRNKIKDIEIN